MGTVINAHAHKRMYGTHKDITAHQLQMFSIHNSPRQTFVLPQRPLCAEPLSRSCPLQMKADLSVSSRITKRVLQRVHVPVDSWMHNLC